MGNCCSSSEKKFFSKKPQKYFIISETLNEHEGKIRYQINRDAPAIVALESVLGQQEKELFEMVLSQIECYLPKYSISNDNMDALTIVNSGDDAEEESLIKEIETIISLCDDDIKADVLNNIFAAENYQKLIGRKEEIKRRILGDGKQL